MATPTVGLALSLSQDEIPVKLRCASCNKLIINAFRLPCCDQNICDNCQVSLAKSCPVCMHSPLSVGDCKPNKSLRLTIKAFLKSEEKRRNKDQATASTPEPENSATVLSTTSLITNEPGLPGQILKIQDQHEESIAQAEMIHRSVSEDTGDNETPSSPSSSIEITLEAPSHAKDSHRPAGFARHLPLASSAVGNSSGQNKNGQIAYSEGISLQSTDSLANQESNLNFQPMGSNFMGMSNFGGIPITSDMSSVMAMQNSMNSANWSGFSNMLGMPGMGVDFMSMSPGMLGSFNGQGIGLHGMNSLQTGIGFDRSYGNWGNHPAMGINSVESGNFDANAGHYPANGYNQQWHQRNFNQIHHQQFPMNNYKQNRFQGHGAYHRGYDRDRGNKIGPYHVQENLSQTLTGGQTNLNRISVETPEKMAHQDSKTSEKTNESGPKKETEEISLDSTADLQAGSSMKQEFEQSNTNNANCVDSTRVPIQEGPINDIVNNEEQPQDTTDTFDNSADESAKPQRIPAFLSSEPTQSAEHVSNSFNEIPLEKFAISLGPAADLFSPVSVEAPTSRTGPIQRFSQGINAGGGRLPSANSTSQMRIPTGQGVEGAPTGPKAMRDGPRNVGFRGRADIRATARRGYQEQTPKLGESTATQSINSTMDQGRSRSPHESNSHDSHREREHPASPEKLMDLSDREGDGNTRDDQPNYNRDGQYSEVKRRSRGSTPESTSTHRRHRERSKRRSSRHERDRDRGRDYDRKMDQTRKSSPRDYEHLSNLQCNRDPEISRHRPRDRPAYRHAHESTEKQSRKRSRSEISTSPNRIHGRRDHDRSPHLRQQNHQPSKSHVGIKHNKEKRSELQEFKIKDRSKKTAFDFQKDNVHSENANMDPNTLEREARNRERLFREQQRRDSLAASVGTSKRSVKGYVEDANHHSSRRKSRNNQLSARRDRTLSYQYDEDEESKESRALRVESEREAARWVPHTSYT